MSIHEKTQPIETIRGVTTRVLGRISLREASTVDEDFTERHDVVHVPSEYIAMPRVAVTYEERIAESRKRNLAWLAADNLLNNGYVVPDWELVALLSTVDTLLDDASQQRKDAESVHQAA